jgi:hypothetical protein
MDDSPSCVSSVAHPPKVATFPGSVDGVSYQMRVTSITNDLAKVEWSTGSQAVRGEYAKHLRHLVIAYHASGLANMSAARGPQ